MKQEITVRSHQRREPAPGNTLEFEIGGNLVAIPGLVSGTFKKPSKTGERCSFRRLA
jgi:hypothetical protein